MSTLIRPFPFCERVRLLRLFSGMSEASLAKALKCSKRYLKQLESGEISVSVEKLGRLRGTFQISSDQFLDGDLPFFEISLRMNPTPLLERKYRTGTSRSISELYPLIEIFKKSKDENLLLNAFQKMNVNPLIFADPSVLVNRNFLMKVLNSPEIVSYFSNVRAFEKLRNQILKERQIALPTGGSQLNTYNQALIKTWIKQILGSSKMLAPVAVRQRSLVSVPLFLSRSKKSSFIRF